MRIRRSPLAARWTRSRRAKVGVRSHSSRRRGPERPAKAEWKSHRASARTPSAKKRSRPVAVRNQSPSRKKASKKGQTATDPKMPPFITPQLCTSVDRPPAGGEWVHEIKFDGYRIQMRVESGEVTLKTRKGLDWTPKFGAIARAASKLPDCIVDGEIVALDHRGSPDFAGLQAALSDGKTDDLIYFAFDFLFLKGQDLRQQRLADRKLALKKLIEKAYGKDQAESATSSISRAAVMRSSNPLAGCHWKKSSPSKQPPVMFPDGADSWIKAKCRAGHEVVIGGWNSNGSQFKSLMAGVYRGCRDAKGRKQYRYHARSARCGKAPNSSMWSNLRTNSPPSGRKCAIIWACAVYLREGSCDSRASP